MLAEGDPDRARGAGPEFARATPAGRCGTRALRLDARAHRRLHRRRGGRRGARRQPRAARRRGPHALRQRLARARAVRLVAGRAPGGPQPLPSGYRRAEILAALFNGVTLVAISIWIFIEAANRFGGPPEVDGGDAGDRGRRPGRSNAARRPRSCTATRGTTSRRRRPAMQSLCGWLGGPAVGALTCHRIGNTPTRWSRPDSRSVAESWGILRDSPRSCSGLQRHQLVDEIGRAWPRARGQPGPRLHVWTITSVLPRSPPTRSSRGSE